MELIKLLGNKLAEKINVSSPAGRGLIKLAIKDELGPFKPLNQLEFIDFKNTITNSLKIRLEKLEISSTREIIDLLLENLTKNQSLITIGGV
jgi:hypothetical protein